MNHGARDSLRVVFPATRFNRNRLDFCDWLHHCVTRIAVGRFRNGAECCVALVTIAGVKNGFANLVVHGAVASAGDRATNSVAHVFVAGVVNRLPDVAVDGCLLYTSPSPRDQRGSRMPSSA